MQVKSVLESESFTNGLHAVAEQIKSQCTACERDRRVWKCILTGQENKQWKEAVGQQSRLKGQGTRLEDLESLFIVVCFRGVWAENNIKVLGGKAVLMQAIGSIYFTGSIYFLIMYKKKQTKTLT